MLSMRQPCKYLHEQSAYNQRKIIQIMLTKRKTDPIQAKSKQKPKPTKDKKDVKKGKKQTAQKIDKPKATGYKKPSSKLAHNSKQINEEDFEVQNQNENRSNLLQHFNQHAEKIEYRKHYDEPQATMRRSASAGGIKGIRKIRNSLSPALNKEVQEKSDIKQKYCSKPTSRSEKQKAKEVQKLADKIKSVTIKKTSECLMGDKNKLTRNKSEKLIKNPNQRLKTENSSKVPEVKQQKSERVSQKKKSYKTNKTKSLLKCGSKAKLKTIKIADKQKQRRSIIFSDVSFHDVSPLYSAILPKQNFYMKLEKVEKEQQNKINTACTTIQKHFRGYLTRKYINQTKFMIYCVVKIQKCWRGFACRKKLQRQRQGKKNLSIENSLITIKDFSEDPREQKLKHKFFKFSFEDDSRKKQDSTSKKKIMREEQQKYINILESLLQEEGLEERFKQKIRVTLGREKYVQKKIKNQIISEKSFNSPRQLSSPKTTMIVNSPSSWSKQKPPDVVESSCMSPRHINEAISKRMVSPHQNKSMSASNKKQQSDMKDELVEIKPIEISFDFIEEFELKIVDYLRDNLEVKEVFLDICKKCQHFRTYLVLSQWNLDQQYHDKSLNFLQPEIYPDIFSTAFRQQILSESSMKLYLEDNNYLESLWESNRAQSELYQAYIRCIFDSLTEAIYDNYRREVVTKKIRGHICYCQGNELFKLIFMNSLTLMQSWNQYMCGTEIPVPEDDPNYARYTQKNKERLEIMIKNELDTDQFNDHEATVLWAELAISESIMQDLVGELYNQFFI